MTIPVIILADEVKPPLLSDDELASRAVSLFEGLAHTRSLDAVPFTATPSAQLEKGVHVVALGASEKAPVPHTSQRRSVELVGASATRVPGSHTAHVAHTVADTGVPCRTTNCPLLHVPQGWQKSALKAFEKVPAEHATHWRSRWTVPLLSTRAPQLHVLHDRHCPALLCAEYVPCAQGTHTRSELMVGGTATEYPVSHTVANVQETSLTFAAYELGPHSWQRRSDVVVRGAITCEPASHTA